MANVTRRALVKASTYTVAALAAPIAYAQGTSVAQPTQGRRKPDIQRFAPTPKLPGVPLISFGVVHGDIVHLAGITANPLVLGTGSSRGAADALGDVADQTRKILARIDALLATAGTTKANLLSAQVWLTDMKNFAAHNDAWNEWVDPKNPPVRACLQSPQLFLPGLLVEIMVTAAR